MNNPYGTYRVCNFIIPRLLLALKLEMVRVQLDYSTATRVYQPVCSLTVIAIAYPLCSGLCVCRSFLNPSSYRENHREEIQNPDAHRWESVWGTERMLQCHPCCWQTLASALWERGCSAAEFFLNYRLSGMVSADIHSKHFPSVYLFTALDYEKYKYFLYFCIV